jgi:hypothetical protein
MPLVHELSNTLAKAVNCTARPTAKKRDDIAHEAEETWRRAMLKHKCTPVVAMQQQKMHPKHASPHTLLRRLPKALVTKERHA